MYASKSSMADSYLQYRGVNQSFTPILGTWIGCEQNTVSGPEQICKFKLRLVREDTVNEVRERRTRGCGCIVVKVIKNLMQVAA